MWLQKSASIQKRTSPLKFDHFRSKIPDFIDRIFQQRVELEIEREGLQLLQATELQRRAALGPDGIVIEIEREGL